MVGGGVDVARGTNDGGGGESDRLHADKISMTQSKRTSRRCLVVFIAPDFSIEVGGIGLELGSRWFNEYRGQQRTTKTAP